MTKLRLEKEKTRSVHVSEMEDGDIAVITSWSHSEYVERVVQRYGNKLISLGLPERYTWSAVCMSRENVSEKCCVRILESGETLIVE